MMRFVSLLVDAAQQFSMAVSFTMQQQPPCDLHHGAEQSGGLAAGLRRNGQVCGRLVPALGASQRSPLNPKLVEIKTLQLPPSPALK